MSADECESAFKYARRDANAKLARADTLGVLAIVLGRLSTLRNQLSVDSLLSSHVVLRFQQNLFWRFGGKDIGPWQLGDLWGHSNGQSRHESVFQFIYQF